MSSGLTVVFMISYVPYHVLWTHIICIKEVKNFYERTVYIILDSNYKLEYMYLISTVHVSNFNMFTFN